jgi:hypothetical protein
VTSPLLALLLVAAQSSQPAASSQPAPASQPSMVAPDEGAPDDGAPDDGAPASQPAAPTSQPGDVAVVLVEGGAAQEPPLRLREDVLPWTAFAAGMAFTVGGMFVAFLGAWPALSILREQAIIADVNGRAFQEGDQSLIALRTAAIYDRNLAFQRYGAPVLAAGVGMMLCGALVAAGGFYTGIRLTAGE